MCINRISLEVVGERLQDKLVKHRSIVNSCIIQDLVESANVLMSTITSETARLPPIGEILWRKVGRVEPISSDKRNSIR